MAALANASLASLTLAATERSTAAQRDTDYSNEEEQQQDRVPSHPSHSK